MVRISPWQYNLFYFDNKYSGLTINNHTTQHDRNTFSRSKHSWTSYLYLDTSYFYNSKIT